MKWSLKCWNAFSIQGTILRGPLQCSNVISIKSAFAGTQETVHILKILTPRFLLKCGKRISPTLITKIKLITCKITNSSASIGPLGRQSPEVNNVVEDSACGALGKPALVQQGQKSDTVCQVSCKRKYS